VHRGCSCRNYLSSMDECMVAMLSRVWLRADLPGRQQCWPLCLPDLFHTVLQSGFTCQGGLQAPCCRTAWGAGSHPIVTLRRCKGRCHVFSFDCYCPLSPSTEPAGLPCSRAVAVHAAAAAWGHPRCGRWPALPAAPCQPAPYSSRQQQHPNRQHHHHGRRRCTVGQRQQCSNNRSSRRRRRQTW